MTTISDWIAASAGFIALLALIVSWRSHVIAKKAQGIAEENHKNQLKEISSYLVESFKWEAENKLYISFSISFTNEATIQNSISFVSLRLRLKNTKKIYPELSIQPTPKTPTSGAYKILEFPTVFGGREAKSGWITFELPLKLLRETTVDTYTLEAKTASGNITKTKTNLVAYIVE